MCNEENRDQFEEMKEEIREAAESLADAVKEKAEEWKEKAEEFCEQAAEAEDISDLGKEDAEAAMEEKVKACGCEEEASECGSEGEETAEEAKQESRFIRRTANGFEVDTNEIESALRTFGEKIQEAMNSVQKGVQESFNTAQDRANAKKKADKLAKMLPYMDEAEIHEIAAKVIEGDAEFKDVDIASLMPFMSKEDCGALFEKSLAANDENPGVDGKLYLKCVPYVGEEVLTKLVDRYVAGGFENIRMDNIYPYLSSADVKRIFYYELKK